LTNAKIKGTQKIACLKTTTVKISGRNEESKSAIIDIRTEGNCWMIF
jgi:hypothetical protein